MLFRFALFVCLFVCLLVCVIGGVGWVGALIVAPFRVDS